MEDVTDASDWTVAEMREFDSKLRCPICHNYYRATMMLPTCLHNFCSLCIRRALLGERKCPVCMVAVSKDELIGNHLLDQLVNSFIAARPILLKALLEKDKGHVRLPMDTRQSSRERARREESKKIEENDGEDLVKQGEMQCPICQDYFLQEIVEEHVDHCLLHSSIADDPVRRSHLPVTNGTTKRSGPIHPMRRPVYNLLKDSEIKKLLRDLDLPTGGDRDMMIRRHSEFVLLYNAECDAAQPKSMAQLRSEVRAMERAWSRRPAAKLLDFGKDEEFESKANAEHYSSLIERVKGYNNDSSSTFTGGSGGATSDS